MISKFQKLKQCWDEYRPMINIMTISDHVTKTPDGNFEYKEYVLSKHEEILDIFDECISSQLQSNDTNSSEKTMNLKNQIKDSFDLRLSDLSRILSAGYCSTDDELLALLNRYEANLVDG